VSEVNLSPVFNANPNVNAGNVKASDELNDRKQAVKHP